ncbi:MAG: 30S ribosome-binding factor RbfA [Clostridia bacterium]|nr:30S ribosome-binding factor RbfA [Clostridia bacterium]
MANYRRERIDEDSAKELALIIRTLKDPRIPSFVSVTSAHVTPDMKYCKAYVSVMGDDSVKKEAMEGLKSASGYIKKELSTRLRLRITPEITFALDTSLDYAVKIEGILKDIEKKEAATSGPEEEKK